MHEIVEGEAKRMERKVLRIMTELSLPSDKKHSKLWHR